LDKLAFNFLFRRVGMAGSRPTHFIGV